MIDSVYEHIDVGIYDHLSGQFNLYLYSSEECEGKRRAAGNRTPTRAIEGREQVATDLKRVFVLASLNALLLLLLSQASRVNLCVPFCISDLFLFLSFFFR